MKKRQWKDGDYLIQEDKPIETNGALFIPAAPRFNLITLSTPTFKRPDVIVHCISKKAKVVWSYQLEWLKFLNAISIKPPKLGRTQRDGQTPGTRKLASEHYEHEPWQYRVVMHNELAYDIDVVDWELQNIILNPVLQTLSRLNIPYVMAGSGGSKSVHLHIFIKPTIWFVRYGWKEVRLALWHWILDQANIPMEMRGDGRWSIEANSTGEWKKKFKIKPTGKYYETSYPFDSSCVNFSDMAVGGKVIRDFGGSKNEGMTRKTIIFKLPDKREDIYKEDSIIFPQEVALWDVTSVIEKLLVFKWQPPKNCSQCPVDPDWMLQFENIEEYIEKHDSWLPSYPKICRECGIHSIEE